MKEQELEKRILGGERVPLLMKGVVHFAWNMPKEDFGFKHTLTFSPMVKSKIYRTYNDLLFSLSEIDPNWEITEIIEITEEEEEDE